MKKTVILLSILFVSLLAHSQQIGSSPIYFKDGKVGVGIDTPMQSLQIEDGELGIGDQTADNWLRLFQLQTDAYGYDIMYDNASVLVNEQGTYNQALILGDVTNVDNRVLFGISHKQGADWIPKLTLSGKGNLGLGTVNPGYKLDVIGTIRAQELKVDMQGADFVFEEDYNLRPLSEVETFVKANKHLPEIAPAAEMQVNGVNQSEMNQKLLQKIEELTLYLIEMKKEIAVLKETK